MLQALCCQFGAKDLPNKVSGGVWWIKFLKARNYAWLLPVYTVGNPFFFLYILLGLGSENFPSLSFPVSQLFFSKTFFWLKLEFSNGK